MVKIGQTSWPQNRPIGGSTCTHWLKLVEQCLVKLYCNRTSINFVNQAKVKLFCLHAPHTIVTCFGVFVTHLNLLSLPVAYAFNDDHQTANKLREEKALPVYLELLGDHPFTATLMDDAGTSYQSLGDYDNAVKYIGDALSMRVRALGDHQETARSWHDLGKALQAKGHHMYNEALDAFKQSLTIQLKVLGAHQETVRSHQQIARVLRELGREEEARNEETKAARMLSSIKELQPTI